MALDREGLSDALLEHLKTYLSDTIRDFKLVDVGGETIPKVKLPTLVLRVHGGDSNVLGPYDPPQWRRRYSLAIYDQGPANELDPDASLQDLAAKVEAALERKDGDPAGAWWTTLGGKCYRAYPISEDLESGEPGSLKIAVIGVEIVALPPTPGRP